MVPGPELSGLARCRPGQSPAGKRVDLDGNQAACRVCGQRTPPRTRAVTRPSTGNEWTACNSSQCLTLSQQVCLTDTRATPDSGLSVRACQRSVTSRDYYADVRGRECCYDWERRCRLAQITHSRPAHAYPQPACIRDPLSWQTLSAEAHGNECCLLHRSSISEGSPKRHPFGFHVQQQKNLDDHVHLQQVPGKQGAQGQAPRERLIDEQTPHMSRRAPRYVNTASVCHF